MATPAELAFERTDLDEEQLAHLQRLLGTWGILADLSFSDLVLMAPMAPEPADPHPGGLELVVLGQMRPSNSSTVVEHDLVGQTVDADDLAPRRADLRDGRVLAGRDAPRAGRGARPAALHPGALRRGDGGGADPAVGGCRPPARPPRAHLPRRLQPVRRHAVGGDLPVPERGGRHRGGAPGRRRRGPRRRGGPGPLRVAERHQRPPPDGHVLPDRGAPPHRPRASRSRPSSGRWPRRCRSSRRSSAVPT